MLAISYAEDNKWSISRLRSPINTARALREDGIAFPSFPPELGYVASRTQFRTSLGTPAGYAVTPALVSGLAQTPALIEVWCFSNQPPITDKLQNDCERDKAPEAYRREEAKLEQRIKWLKGCLRSSDPEKEETYWSLIRDAQD